ncbi:type II toxin-antitoxin system YoeB family toxin, partial [Kingella kingae]
MQQNVTKQSTVLIKDTQRNPFEGLGNPEPLKHQFS